MYMLNSPDGSPGDSTPALPHVWPAQLCSALPWLRPNNFPWSFLDVFHAVFQSPTSSGSSWVPSTDGEVWARPPPTLSWSQEPTSEPIWIMNNMSRQWLLRLEFRPKVVPSCSLSLSSLSPQWDSHAFVDVSEPSVLQWDLESIENEWRTRCYWIWD